MKIEFHPKIFISYSNIKFHENPSSGSRVVPWGQTDGGTDMTKLKIAFQNFVRFAHTMHVRILFDRRNKQRLFIYTGFIAIPRNVDMSGAC